MLTKSAYMMQEKEVSKDYNHIRWLIFKDNTMWLFLSIRNKKLAAGKNRYDFKQCSDESIEDRPNSLLFSSTVPIL